MPLIIFFWIIQPFLEKQFHWRKVCLFFKDNFQLSKKSPSQHFKKLKLRNIEYLLNSKIKSFSTQHFIKTGLPGVECVILIEKPGQLANKFIKSRVHMLLTFSPACDCRHKLASTAVPQDSKTLTFYATF